MKRKYLCLYCLQFFLIFFVFSKNILAQNFSYKIYSVADGLPGGSVQSIFQDSHGYLWVSTYADLFRFDGSTFTKMGAAENLPGTRDFIFFEDSSRQLWGATVTGKSAQVIKFADGKFSLFPFPDKDSVQYIFSFYQHSGETFKVCTDRGVFERNNNQWIKEDIGIDPGLLPIRHMIRMADGSLFICTPLKLFKKKQDGKLEVIADTTNCSGYYQIRLMDNRIFITGEDRLFFYDNTKGLVPFHDDVIKRQYMNVSFVDDFGRIFVAGERDGLLVFDGSSVLAFGKKQGLLQGFTSSICEDNEGDIWIGTLGLISLKFSQADHFVKSDGLQNSDTRSVFIDKSGNAYFGDAGDGFSFWNRHQFIPSSAMLGAPALSQFEGHILYYLAQDEKGAIWMMLNSNKLVRYSNYQLEDVSARFNPLQKRIGEITFDNTDSAMLIPLDSIIKVRNDKVTDKIPLIINHFKERPYILCLDHNHRLWIGASDGYIGYMDLKSKIFYPAGPTIPRTQFTRIICDEDGSVWAASNGYGIFHFIANQSGKIILLGSVTEKDGLFSNVIFDLALDKSGWLWAITADGITRFNIRSKNPYGNYTKQKFNSNDGLDPVSYVDAHIRVDLDDNVWISTYSGVYRLQQKNIHIDSLPPKVQIEKVSILNDTINWLNYAKTFTDYFHLPVNATLPYNKNNITINFNTIAYTGRGELECEYKLEGLQTTWITSNAKSSASYVNLPARKYIFRVRARRENYAWSEEATFAFTITPPFWETWWFRLLVIITASAVLIIVFRNRIAQINRKAKLQQQMQELEMQALKARMNPHFIYNAMNSIQSLVMNEEPEAAVRYVGKFAKLLRQVLDNSDKSFIPLDRELSSLQLYIELETLRLNVDFDYAINVDPSLNPEEESTPPLILQPYVENALWHGLSNKQGAKKLSVNIFQKENYLVAEIIDNGIGRDKAAGIKSKNTAATLSKGLNITMQRLELINNKNISPVQIEDLFDANGNAAGTKVTVKILRHAAE